MANAWKPKFLRWVGLGAAWLAAPLAAPEPGDWRLPLWLSNLVVFSALFWIANSTICARWSATRQLLVNGALALFGLASVAFGDVFAATYPVLVAAQAGSTLVPRAAWALVGAQTAALFLAFSRLSFMSAALLALVFGGLMLFVVHTAQVALAEGTARLRLAQAHRELETAQVALAERSRDAERIRISSDLHDVLGHHLTALSLTLEAASHSGPELQRQAIEDSLVVSKRLLRDLREVVSRLSDEPSDLAAALGRLAGETRSPRVTFERSVDPSPPLPADRSRALLRAAQEAITNAVRHGRAATVRLALDEVAPDGIAGLRLRVLDDGVGTDGAAGAGVVAGRGLSGIAERARDCGGRASWGFCPEGGFAVEVWVPRSVSEP